MQSKSQTSCPEARFPNSDFSVRVLWELPGWQGGSPTSEGLDPESKKPKQVVVQSNTILRYVGRLTGLLPESPLALAKLEAIMDFMVARLTADTPCCHLFWSISQPRNRRPLEFIARGPTSQKTETRTLTTPWRIPASCCSNAQAMDVEPLALCSHLQAPRRAPAGFRPPGPLTTPCSNRVEPSPADLMLPKTLNRAYKDVGVDLRLSGVPEGFDS